MKGVLLILFGALGGILGGMGMGGGTLLIPLLTVGLNMLQIKAQAINLIAFLPMSVFALIIHSKSGLVKFKISIPIAISGVISSIGAAIMASHTKSICLSIWFGIFLILIGVFDIYSLCLRKNKNKTIHNTLKNKW